jgi:hypothetical protein
MAAALLAFVHPLKAAGPVLAEQPAVQRPPAPPTLRAWAPRIDAVDPTGCVRPGGLVTLTGANFGEPKPAALSLAVQPRNGAVKTVAEKSWSASAICFTLPIAAGIAAGSTFTAGIVRDGEFVVSVELAACAAPPARTPEAFRFPGRVPTAEVLSPGVKVGAVSPAGCVAVGKRLTATGTGFGPTQPAAGFTLALRTAEGGVIELAPASWSPTAIVFVVPAAAGGTSWLTLGTLAGGGFTPQLDLAPCGGGSGAPGGWVGGGSESYGGVGTEGGDASPGGAAGSGAPAAGGPKGSRLLTTQAPVITPEQTPAGDATAGTGSRAVGGKVLAMRALARRGLVKVNQECDLLAAACPCCRKDGSVCFEREADNEDGTSRWRVRWKEGAKRFDGKGPYGARDAREDVQEVTGLQCELAKGDAAGVAVLGCR